MELCLNSMGGKKLQYLNYFMHRINLLRHNKIIPVVVFDGGPIPCKAATEQARRRQAAALIFHCFSCFFELCYCSLISHVGYLNVFCLSI